jgi:hypothetical protein
MVQIPTVTKTEVLRSMNARITMKIAMLTCSLWPIVTTTEVSRYTGNPSMTVVIMPMVLRSTQDSHTSNDSDDIVGVAECQDNQTSDSVPDLADIFSDSSDFTPFDSDDLR